MKPVQFLRNTWKKRERQHSNASSLHGLGAEGQVQNLFEDDSSQSTPRTSLNHSPLTSPASFWYPEPEPFNGSTSSPVPYISRMESGWHAGNTFTQQQPAVERQHSFDALHNVHPSAAGAGHYPPQPQHPRAEGRTRAVSAATSTSPRRPPRPPPLNLDPPVYARPDLPLPISPTSPRYRNYTSAEQHPPRSPASRVIHVKQSMPELEGRRHAGTHQTNGKVNHGQEMPRYAFPEMGFPSAASYPHTFSLGEASHRVLTTSESSSRPLHSQRQRPLTPSKSSAQPEEESPSDDGSDGTHRLSEEFSLSLFPTPPPLRIPQPQPLSVSSASSVRSPFSSNLSTPESTPLVTPTSPHFQQGIQPSPLVRKQNSPSSILKNTSSRPINLPLSPNVTPPATPLPSPLLQIHRSSQGTRSQTAPRSLRIAHSTSHLREEPLRLPANSHRTTSSDSASESRSSSEQRYLYSRSNIPNEEHHTQPARPEQETHINWGYAM